ncbi:TPA: hypothetical protein MYO83_004711 [Klebsiella michiganensis]|nr:hypothetical protein [Klebsiella michiganensis]HCB1848081.1 hypothetical protein [Klebsiella oxytoca]
MIMVDYREIVRHISRNTIQTEMNWFVMDECRWWLSSCTSAATTRLYELSGFQVLPSLSSKSKLARYVLTQLVVVPVHNKQFHRRQHNEQFFTKYFICEYLQVVAQFASQAIFFPMTGNFFNSHYRWHIYPL